MAIMLISKSVTEMRYIGYIGERRAAMKPILDLGAGPMLENMPKPASAKKVGT